MQKSPSPTCPFTYVGPHHPSLNSVPRYGGQMVVSSLASWGVDRVGWTEMKEAGLKGGMLHPVAQTAAGEFVVEWQLVLPSTGALPDEPSSTPAPRDPSYVTDPGQLSRLVRSPIDEGRSPEPPPSSARSDRRRA